MMQNHASVLDPVTREQARRYDELMSDKKSYDGWLWCLERVYVMQILDRRFRNSRPRYLDFACGTGRIIAPLEGGRMATSSGIDVSANMLERARRKLQWSNLILGDPTIDASLAPGPYELITAFRFLMNADDALRARALRYFWNVLTDDGVLIVDLEANATSLWMLDRAARSPRRRGFDGRRSATLSFWGMRRLLRRHGFEVVEVRGYGFLPPRWHRLLTATTSLVLERFGKGPVKYFAGHLMFVCQKRPSGVRSRQSSSGG
jgi:SAM-dependent methyltransferase